MGKKILVNNPLLDNSDNAEEEEPVLTKEEIETIKEAQGGSIEDFTTMTFKVRKTTLKTLRDYAFTNRLKIKQALDEILTKYFESIDTSKLMEYPEMPKQTRRKRG